MKKNEKQVLIMLDSGSNGGRNLLPPIIINLFWSILSFSFVTWVYPVRKW
jgi:hypothetical protein